MKPWRQTEEYACIRCDERVLHDAMHNHALHECPMRPKTKKQLLLAGKIYEPKAS